MKNFDEQFTAWVDNALDETERTAFEKELAQKPEWYAAGLSDQKLGELMRSCLAAPAMDSPDFFNQHILEAIREETTPVETKSRSGWGSFWIGWPKFALASGFALILALFVQKNMIVPSISESIKTASVTASAPSPSILTARPLFSQVSTSAHQHQVLYAKSPDPKINASTFTCPDDSYTVIWTEGMDYIPANYTFK